MEWPCHGRLQNTRFNVGSFMCAAAGNGDKARLEWVIGLPNGTEQLEYRNESGLTPLLIACSKGHKECVALLLENGANLHATVEMNGGTVTALKLAEKSNHTETINYVKTCLDEISTHGDCLAKLKREMIAICSRSKSTPEELERLRKLTKLFKVDESFDEPLIIRACKAGNQELIDHMVDNLHVTHYSNDSEGSSMLHIALKNKSDLRFTITKRFPELVTTIDTRGRYPMHIACDNNDMDYVKWLFGLALIEMKPSVPAAPPSTPLQYIGVTNPPFLPQFGVVMEETETGDHSSKDGANNDSEALAPPPTSHKEKCSMPTSLSSSDVQLLVENLENTIPTGPLIPVTYKQHLMNMKLYSVDTEGENILHVLVKNNHHQLLEYILKTYPHIGSSPAQRDFWVRAEKIGSPIDEAVTRGHAECLDIMMEVITNRLDPTKLYSNDALLPTAVITNHFSVVKVLIRYGVHPGLVKSLRVANNSNSLPLLLFYNRIVEMIKDGAQHVNENAVVLDWRNYFLSRIEVVWLKLASDAVGLVQDAFTKFPDLPCDAMMRQIGPRVLDHYSRHIDEPIGCLTLECFTDLRLSENEIEMVPEELFNLPCLKELDLSSNQLQQLPTGPSTQKCYPCNSLKNFTIRHNSLTTLPSWLFLLPNLAMVDACYNLIKELPTSVWISPSLHTLNLGRNKLSRLHELSDDKANYQALKPRFDVLYSQLEYREAVSKEISSSDVDRDENTGSTPHGEDEDDSTILCHLKHLDLSYNKFISFPKDLVCLAPKLEKLFLNSNNITSMDLVKDLPISITTVNMQSCDLKDTSVKRDPSQTCGDILHLITGADITAGYCDHCNHDYLANLGSLNLKNNKLSLLQVATEHNRSTHALFPGLSVMDVSNNQLVKVPDCLELLTELSSLNLSDNLITTMPFSISQLSQLWVINVDNLHLSNVPNSILDTHSATELKNYLKNLHQKSQPYRRMRLMFVGESNKGKTSLLMALTKRGKVNHYQDIRLNVNRKPLSTVGVDLGDWEYAKQTSILQAGKKITFMTWDFGGQEEYYATHQCFLSPHALYIVVWSVVDGIAGLENLRPWLENIESRAMGAPVIVVGTHADLWDTQAQSLHRSALEEAFTKKFTELYIDCDRKQRKTYPKILEKLFFVDTYNKEHINKLRDTLYDFALEYKVASSNARKNSTPLLDELVPACYVSLEENIRAIAIELRDKKEIPILTHQEYIKRVKLLHNFTKMSTNEIKQATQFLHDKGILLHYDEGQLSDLYFMDPQWLCSMLAKVIAIPEVQSYHKNGFIGRNELGRILEHADACINLMQKFEVLFELDSKRYLIPSLLPVDEDKACVIFPRSLKSAAPQPATKLTSVAAIPMGSHSNCLVRFFMLPFIPNGMFPRLLARLIATEVIEQVLSSLKVNSLVDDQQLINRLHWRAWRNGITLVWRHIQIFRIVPMKLPLPGISIVHVIQPKDLSSDYRNVYEGDSIMVQVDILPDNAFTDGSNTLQMATWLLHQAVEQINSVFENWYEEFAWKRNIDITVAAADPCPHCMRTAYEHLTPDLYAAQKRLVDEPKALQQAKVKEKKRLSILGSLTMARSNFSVRRPRTGSNADQVIPDASKGIAPSVSSWTPGRLYGKDEMVLYLFSIKLSAVSVMEVTVLTCPIHGAITIDQIAPDMIFADLSLNMRVCPEHVIQKQYLDEGGFGAIYAASVKLRDGETKEVVIKTYTVSEGASSNRTKGEIAWHHYQNANSEGRIMASLRHANILNLVGIALQPIRLLLEFAPLGSLKNIVNRYQDNDSRMNRYALQKVIIQVSSAMDHIHHKKIIYRDLKLANVLVFEFPDPRLPLEGQRHCKVLVKLADYGISKQVVPWGIRGMTGTPFYLAPEVVLHGGKQAYTNKIDVYSFGIMLSYLFTYAKPFGKIIRPLRAYLEAGQRPDMTQKHRPSCEWMYELMCWSWSDKPQHRPSFVAIRQCALSEVFTRLHYAMRVEPSSSEHMVSAIAVRYYRTITNASTVNEAVTQSYPYRNIADKPPMKKLSLQISGSSISQPVVDDNAEVYYGMDNGVVGIVNMQQSSTSYQLLDDIKSPVTCLLVVNDYLWVSSHRGVMVYNTVNRQGSWVNTSVVVTMILVPCGHCDDDEAIVMFTASSKMLIYAVDGQQSLQKTRPDREIEMNHEVSCALLVPTIEQLWACSTDSKLTIFKSGCYHNPEKYDMPDMPQPRCIATVNDFVLAAAESKIQKWNTTPPSVMHNLDCEGTIMDSTTLSNEQCHITSMLGINEVLYAGTRGGAIIAVDVDKLIIRGIMCAQTSPVKSLALLKQASEAKVTTLKRRQDSLVLGHALHHDPQDDFLLVSFARDYRGITHNRDDRPETYNLPSMTSHCRYHQPTPSHDPKDLYMLLWSAHPW